ncbi:MAG: MarR family transcriptional regulator [Flammeovirgaceae bacterium]|nr:MarR family transcriptional regulator [Flammeovirgaceae bacterium]
MKLEEEIKQSKFLSEKHKLVVNLIYTTNWLMYHQTVRLKPYGISPQQYNVLRILRGQYPNPAMLALIQERMLDKSSNATRLVEKLRLKGLVTRNLCEHNRRQVDILITQKGLDLLKTLDQEIEAEIQKFSFIKETDAKFINDILDELRDQK